MPHNASVRDLQLMLDALNGGGQCKAVAVRCASFIADANPLAVGVMNLPNFFAHRSTCRACFGISTDINALIADAYERES